MATQSHDANFLYINMIEIHLDSFGFLLFLLVVTLFGLKIETIRATNRIRKKFVDMDYSPKETESLTKGIMVVCEGYRKSLRETDA
jgi:hypothetical protein